MKEKKFFVREKSGKQIFFVFLYALQNGNTVSSGLVLYFLRGISPKRLFFPKERLLYG